jgi:hypothetical protein
MKSVRSFVLGTALVSFLTWLMPAAPAAAQPTPHDIVTVATVGGTGGSSIDVPVYINDLSGTTLGLDQPAGSRIQSYGIRISASNAVYVQSMTLTRGGITQPLTPTFETNPTAPGVATLIDTFTEATNLIPFTLDGAAPGNQVATLHVTLVPFVPAGTVITLTLDPLATELTNESGTPTTAETVANGRLLLVNGAINVAAAAAIPTLTQWALILLAIMLAAIAIRTRL